MSSKFIVLEGLDGVGKTTHLEYLKKAILDSRILSKGDAGVITFKDPGSSKVGEKLRQILLHDKLDLSAEAETMLFMASRAQIRKEIIDNLIAGNHVLMDRYYPSTYAYQNLDLEQLKVLKDMCCIEPSLKILLMSTKERQLGSDNFESRDARFRKQAGQKYLDLTRKDRGWAMINSDGAIGETHSKIVKVLVERFPQDFKELKPLTGI